MWIGNFYNTHQVAELLKVGRSTLNKHARSLENGGYTFKKGENKRRAYVEHDLIVFRQLMELLSKGADYNSAVKLIADQYKNVINSEYVKTISKKDNEYVKENNFSDSECITISATSDSEYVADLEKKIDMFLLAIQTLFERLNNIELKQMNNKIEEDVKQITTQVNEISKQVQISNDSIENKMDLLISHSLCRLKTHKKRYRWWKFWI